MLLNPAEPDFKNMVLEKFHSNTFTQYIGFKLTHLEAGITEGHLPMRPEFAQQLKFLHGGLTATLSDIVMGFAAFTLIKKGTHVVTADLKIAYLNPAVSDTIYAKGWVIKPGNRLYFCEAEIWTGEGDSKIAVAKASSTMAVIHESDIRK